MIIPGRIFYSPPKNLYFNVRKGENFSRKEFEKRKARGKKYGVYQGYLERESKF